MILESLSVLHGTVNASWYCLNVHWKKVGEYHRKWGNTIES